MEDQNVIEQNAWVARDADGDLFIYMNRPFRDKEDEFWLCRGKDYYPLDESKYPGVTWESEPVEVTVTIKIK